MVCKHLAFDSSVSDQQLLLGVSQAAKVYYNYTGSASCLNTSQTATGSLGFMGWYYQVCVGVVTVNKSLYRCVYLSQPDHCLLLRPAPRW